MKRADFRERLRNLLEAGVDGGTVYDVIREVDSVVWEYASNNTGRVDKDLSPNTGTMYTDEELALISLIPPTCENIVRVAEATGRGVGSIKQLWQWGTTPDTRLKECGRMDNVSGGGFKKHLKRSGYKNITY